MITSRILRSRRRTDHAPRSENLAITLREKLAYATGDIGSNFIYAPATAFVLFYLTNVAGLGAAIAGTILLAGQLLNGATDLAVGVLIDRTNTRWGKTRPWILFSALPLSASFVLLFSVPAGLHETGKAVWTLVMYSLVMAIFFTSSNVAYSALLSVITPDPKTRVTLSTFRFFAALATTLIVTYATLPLVQALGGGQTGWTTTAIIYGAIATLALATVFGGTRERVAVAAETTGSATPPLRAMLRDLGRNKYYFMATGLFAGLYLLLGMTGSAGVYYATSVLGDPSLFGILSVAQFLPPLIGIGFMPAVIGRFGKRQAFLVGIALQLGGTIVPLIGPESFAVVLVGMIIRGFGSVPFAAGLFAIVADVVDYGEWKFTVRTDGLIYSSVVFGQKVGTGLGAALVGWLLAAGGYNAAVTTQIPSAIQAILALYIYIPIPLVLTVGVIVYFFRIEEKGPDIRRYLAHPRGPDSTPPAHPPARS